MLLLCIDPGVAKLAWCLGDENRIIGLDLIKNHDKLSDHALAYYYAHQLPNSHKTVIERSHFFKGESIYILQDLLNVNIVAGYIAGMRSGTLISVAGWRRGKVPKKVQLNRTFKRLSDAEKVMLAPFAEIRKGKESPEDIDDNVMDAVGIYMAVSGRMTDVE